MQRRTTLGLAAALLAGAAPALRAQNQVEAWSRADWAAISAPDLAGTTRRLGDLRGRAIVLNFWASWCEPCRSEMPTLQQLADLYGEDRLAVLALNFKEGPAAVERFVRRTGLRLPVLLDRDGAIARACAVKVFPSTLLIGADGRPRWRVRGELDWTGGEAARLVESLL